MDTIKKLAEFFLYCFIVWVGSARDWARVAGDAASKDRGAGEQEMEVLTEGFGWHTTLS